MVTIFLMHLFYQIKRAAWGSGGIYFKRMYRPMTSSSWIHSAMRNLLELVSDVEKFGVYITKDAMYKMIAIPTTMSRFGPSGSLKNTNSNRESVRDVSPRIIAETFFDESIVLSVTGTSANSFVLGMMLQSLRKKFLEFS